MTIRRWFIPLAGALALCLLFSLALASAAFAQEGDPGDEPDRANASFIDQVTADDGGTWELGVHGSAGNLTTATAAERYGMYVWLNGWFIRRYNWNEATAWEEDFKRSALGGTENSWIDTVDLQFYVGHGSPGRFTFDNNDHDDGALDAANDCNTAWGDGDNEWLALTSCQVLANDGLGKMAQCMNRQHLILGFVSNAAAHNNYWDTQAYHFGRYMRLGYNMTQSWFNACDIAQRNRIARVIAEETACFNDNPYYSSVCADFYDNDYYWWTHYCGTETASAIPLETLAGELPVFRVHALALEETAAEYSRLGDIFSIPVTPTLQAAGLLEDPVDPPVPPDDSPFLSSTSNGQILIMDKASGLYQYSDTGALWNDQQAQQILAAAATAGTAGVNTTFSDADARRIADNFLNQFGLMDAGASFYQVETDALGTLDAKGDVAGAAVAEAETPTNYQVIYTRKLTAEVPLLSGVNVEMDFVVVGPGAKLKVYVPITPTVGAAGVAAQNVIGTQGGWRELEPAVNAATGEAIMTAILDQATAQALYEALEDGVTMASIPLDVESKVVVSGTLAYWESVAGASQGELIPVYEFTVDFTERGSGNVTRDHVYVPASPQYMKPLALITNAPAPGSLVGGTPFTLLALDAAKTLASQAPAWAAFDFVMGYDGADGTYAYEWYLGPVLPENKVAGCTTNECPITLPYLGGDKGAALEVTLVVKDVSSPNQSEGTDTASFDLNPAVFLPAMER